MSLDEYKRYDWGPLISQSSIEDKIKLMAEERRMEVERMYRLWKQHGKGSVAALMLDVFERDEELEIEYFNWLDEHDALESHREDETLLKFLNHRRWLIEQHLLLVV